VGVPVEFAPDGLITQSIRGFLFPRISELPLDQTKRFCEIPNTLAGFRVRSPACKLARSNPSKALQRFYVGDDVLDLLLVQNIFERRHQRVTVFNPGFQIVVGDFIVVHGKRAALRNSF